MLFALPLAATGILQQLFNAADIAVVGRFTGELGTAAMAAVGANGPIVGLVVNTFVGQNYGGGKLDRCKRTVGVCYLEGVIAIATAAAIIRKGAGQTGAGSSAAGAVKMFEPRCVKAQVSCETWAFAWSRLWRQRSRLKFF